MIEPNKIIVSEYDAFGPWIYKITEKNPMPPLFIPYYKENQEYLMLIKIPRDIERRKAKPEMDLYDYVIGMYEDYGYILKRNQKEVEEIRFYYNEVESIENYRSLLLGRLTIYLKSSTLVIPYNTVSIGIIYELMKIIRNKYTKSTYENVPVINKTNNSEIDMLYENLIKEMALKDDVFPIMVSQPAINLNNNKRIGQKILGLIRSKLLLSTVHLLNHKELLIINKGDPIQYGKKPVNSYSFVYIPIEKINNIKFEKSKEHQNIEMVAINTKVNKFNFYFTENNKDLVEFYSKLGEINNMNNF
ncbi:hypothetical protein [Clostridium sp. C2-6-12]|uniref:hypothetical protein n=1 Tax=Clostridium sp. C2-6-12 TaxID=2698832 RepID=UPI001370072D|nr:hypothetical protein [Clostridium sp. C2-6-12]